MGTNGNACSTGCMGTLVLGTVGLIECYNYTLLMFATADILHLTAHLQISGLFRSASYQTLLFAPPILHPDYVTCTCTAAVHSSPRPFVTAELLLVPEHSYGEDLVYEVTDEVTVMAIQEECVQY